MAKYSFLLAIGFAAVIVSAQGADMIPAKLARSNSRIQDLPTGNLSAVAVAALAKERSLYVNGLVIQDPFYMNLPPSAANATPGTLLKVERFSNASLFSLPPTTSLSRFIYQSKTMSGAFVPVSAYILWPYTPRQQDDGYAVVAWAHGTSGISRECAPSHIQNLWQHFLAPYQLASQGYTVVATDYAGLGVPVDAFNRSIIHEYLASPSQANDVIYSVQAARQAFPELSKDWVAMGHSQGAGAVWSVAQKQVTEPAIGFLGAVAVAPTTNNVENTSPTAPLVAAVMAPGITAAIPGFKTTDITTAAGENVLALTTEFGGCSGFTRALVTKAPLLQENWKTNPDVLKFQNLTVNGGKEIAGPLFVCQGDLDTTLNITQTIEAVQATLLNFPSSDLQFVKLPNVTHVSALQACEPMWMDWIKDRFAAADTLKSGQVSTASPSRPASAQEKELNWVISIAVDGALA